MLLPWTNWRGMLLSSFSVIQPAALLGRVVELDTLHHAASAIRLKNFVERSHPMRVEIVANDNHLAAVGVYPLQQFSHFQSPIQLRFLLPDLHFTPSRLICDRELFEIPGKITPDGI